MDIEVQDPLAALTFMKDCLKICGYPRIHSMTDEEIADVFHVSNRRYLVSWLLKLLDEAYEEVLGDEVNDDVLANLVYEHGFCLQTEKNGLFTGALPIRNQLSILYCMFSFVKAIKASSGKPIEKSPESRGSTVDLSELVDRNLNLFPCYGEIRTLNETNRRDMASALLEEKDKLSKNSDTNFQENPNIQSVHKNIELPNLIEKLITQLPRLKKVISKIKREDGIGSVNVFYKADEGTNEVLMKFCKNINVISQFLIDINCIKNLGDNKISIKNGNKLKDLSKMVKCLCQELH